MFNTVKEIIAEELGIDSEEIDEDSRLMEDLGVDSLELVEIVMAVEEAFGSELPDEEIPSIRTVRDLMDLAEDNS